MSASAEIDALPTVEEGSEPATQASSDLTPALLRKPSLKKSLKPEEMIRQRTRNQNSKDLRKRLVLKVALEEALSRSGTRK